MNIRNEVIESFIGPIVDKRLVDADSPETLGSSTPLGVPPLIPDAPVHSTACDSARRSCPVHSPALRQRPCGLKQGSRLQLHEPGDQGGRHTANPGVERIHARVVSRALSADASIESTQAL